MASTKRSRNKDPLKGASLWNLRSIRMTMEETDRESFKAAVDAILAAKRIYILGVRSAAALADFIGFYFNLIDRSRGWRPSPAPRRCWGP